MANWMIWLALTAIIVILAGSNLVGIASFLASLTAETYQGCAVKDGLAIIPLMGYYKCEMLGETCDTIDIPNGFNQEFKTCCDVHATACTYTLIKKSSGEVISSVTVNRGECVTAWKDWPPLIPERYWKRCYHPYTLYSYSPSGGRSMVYQPDKYSCSVPYDKALLISECKGFFQGQCDNTAIVSRWLDFDQSTNYFDKWVVAPVEYNFVNHPTYGKVYCSGDGYLHESTSIQLTSGCYVIPDMNKALPKQQCCPNAISASAICGSDFKWQVISEPECGLLNPCPGANYYVPDYSDPSRKTAIKYSCIDGKCQAVKVTSECTTNEACPVGTVCSLDSNTGIGKCVSSGEVPVPPRPPVVPPEDWELSWFEWLRVYAIAFLLSLVSLGVLVYYAPIPFFKMLRHPYAFLAAVIVLSIVLVTIFSIPVQLLTAQLFGA